MRHSQPACCPPLAAMPASTSKSDRGSIAAISAWSMISTSSGAPAGSEPRDKAAKRQQNPHYGHHNGLIARSASSCRGSAGLLVCPNSAKILLYFQARKPLDVAGHVAAWLNALYPVSRRVGQPILRQLLESVVLLSEARIESHRGVVSEQFLDVTFRSTTSTANIDSGRPARLSC